MIWEKLYPMPRTMYLGRQLVGAAVAALCAGLMIGGTVTYALQPEKTPAACERMAGRSAEVLRTTGKLMSAVQEHAAEEEWQRRAVLAGEIERLSGILEAASPAYDDAHAACMEAVR